MNFCLTQDCKRSVFSPRDGVAVYFTLRSLIRSEKVVNVSFPQWTAAALSLDVSVPEGRCLCPPGTFSRAYAPPSWRSPRSYPSSAVILPLLVHWFEA